jgi:hypothetical protein
MPAGITLDDVSIYADAAGTTLIGEYLFSQSNYAPNNAAMINFADATLARVTDTAKGTYDPTAEDTSTNNRHLQLVGEPQRTVDGLQFDGSNYGKRAVSPFFEVSATELCIEFECDIESADFDGANAIAIDSGDGNPNNNNGLNIAFDDRGGGGQATDGLLIIVATSTTAGTRTVAFSNVMAGLTGKHLFKVTYDAVNFVRLFVDGDEKVGVPSVFGTGDFTPANAVLAVGARNSGVAPIPAGRHLDNVRLYSDAAATTLIAEWLFEEANLRTEGGDLAISFDGTDDYGDSNHDFSWTISDSFAWEVWFKLDSQGDHVLISKMTNNFEYTLRVLNTVDRIEFIYFNDVGASGFQVVYDPIAIGEWNHCVGVYDGSSAYLYINGVLVGSTSTITGPFQDRPLTTTFGAGYHSGGGEKYLDGNLDSCRIWNVALTPSEVYTLYKNGTKPSTPVLEYTMENAADGPRSVLNVKGGKSLDFNGTDDLVNINNDASLSPTDKITCSVWVKLNAFSATKQIRFISKGTDRYVLFIQGNTFHPQAYMSNVSPSDVESTVDLTLGVWHHVVYTYDKDAGANNYNIYVDGELTGTVTAVNNIAYAGQDLRLGASGLDDHYLDGLIDDPRIYSRALSPAEIASLYAGSNPSPTNLVLHQKFDENSDYTGDVDSPIDGNKNNAWGWDTDRWTLQCDHTGGNRRYVICPIIEYLKANKPFTICLNIKREAGWSSDVIFQQYDGYDRIYISGNQDSVVATFDDGVNKLGYWGALANGGDVWATIIMTNDGNATTRPRLFIDGVEATNISDYMLTSSGTRCVIGANNGLTVGFSGKIKDGQFYNRELSEPERNQYDAGTLDPANAERSYPLNDGPNLPGQLLPADGTQDQQWVSDPVQDWAWKGDGSSFHVGFDSPVIDPDSIPLEDFDFKITYVVPTDIGFNDLINNGGQSGSTYGIFIDVYGGGGGQVRVWVRKSGTQGYWEGSYTSNSVGAEVELNIFFNGTFMVVEEDGIEKVSVPINTSGAGTTQDNLIIGRRDTVYFNGLVKKVEFNGVNIPLDEGISGNTVTSGLPINTWKDRSAFRNDAVQYGVLNRPTWISADGDGNPYLSFDGTDDGMVTLLATALSEGMHVFLVGRYTGTDGSAIVELGPNANSDAGFYTSYKITAGNQLITNDDVNPVSITRGYTGLQNEKGIYDGYAENASQRTAFNNSFEVETTNVLETLIADDTLAIMEIRSVFMGGRLFEIILYPKRLEDEDALAVREWLAAKYNITLA